MLLARSLGIEKGANVARQALRAASRASYWKRGLTGAAIGAAGGAAAGGEGNRLKGALVGGALGGAAGVGSAQLTRNAANRARAANMARKAQARGRTIQVGVKRNPAQAASGGTVMRRDLRNGKLVNQQASTVDGYQDLPSGIRRQMTAGQGGFDASGGMTTAVDLADQGKLDPRMMTRNWGR